MRLITTVSGHELAFALKSDPDGRVPRATLSIVTSPAGTKQTALLSGADIEAMIVVLRSIREKQRDYEPAPDHQPAEWCQKCREWKPCSVCTHPAGRTWETPTPADESKAPAPSRAQDTVKQVRKAVRRR